MINVNALFVLWTGAEENSKTIDNKTVRVKEDRVVEQKKSTATETNRFRDVVQESQHSDDKSVIESGGANEKASTEFIEKNRFDQKTLAALERLQLSIARLLQNHQLRDLDKEQHWLHTQQDFSKLITQCQDFAYQTLMFCRFLEDQLNNSEDTEDSLFNVRVQYRLDELKKGARSLYLQTKPPGKTLNNPCRIFDVNKSLDVVALTYGAVNNVRVGLTWQVRIENREDVILKTVAVRAFISAAVVVEGNINDLVPGMTASTNVDNK